MNWKQLPKEKRNHVVLVGLITAMALGAVGFGLIRFQYDHLNQIAEDTRDADRKLSKMMGAINNKEKTEAELAEVTGTLSSVEDGMASGDLYSWVYETVRRFKLSYKIDPPQFSTAEVKDTTLLPKFPYKQVTISIASAGYYHDIGKFIADFENQFPHIRVVNLTIDPVPSLVSSEKEKLEFKMEIVTLVRPNPS
ncbi:MAG: hypothetical protein EXS35_04785 [Pedosphaera sp.]|nr:hypothetical protein [Pedosphaera sp.]